MNERPSAEIIRFPGRAQLPANLATRLAKAILTLHQANSKLGDEFPDLREATKALTANLGEIAKSLQYLDIEVKPASSQPKLDV